MVKPRFSIVGKLRGRTIFFVGIFAIVGVIIITRSYALVSTASVEPENGTKTSSITTVQDATASNSSAVKFGSAQNDFRVGLTLTHESVDIVGSTSVANTVQNELHSAPWLINSHIMGWGVDNPEPAPGQYNFSTLDQRINWARNAGGELIITLCGAPDWMKGGTAGQTNWDNLAVAPTPDHFDDFANLAKTIALRYPDVKYFQIWNEMKGFYNDSLNRWDYEGYTTMYNQVYTAIKSVRPDAKMGGPYIPMTSWVDSGAGGWPSSVRGDWGIVDQRGLDTISYWLDHNVGADFVNMDGGSDTRDGGNPSDPYAAAEKFKAIAAWTRQQTTLPIWWSEIYPSPYMSGTEETKRDVYLHAIDSFKAGGGDVVLLWSEECGTYGYNFGSLWSCSNGATNLLYSVLKASYR